VDGLKYHTVVVEPMGLLNTLKSVLLGEFEIDPYTESEDAVKGTDTEPGDAENTADSDAKESDSESDDEAEATEADEADTAETTDESDAVDTIQGIGPAYSDRLSDAGVETVADLADADPEDLAEATDIGASRIERWVGRADDR